MSRERLVVTGTFGERGKFVADQPNVWATVGARFHGQRVTISIEKERKIRTDRQNRFWWSVIIPVAQEVLSLSRDVPLAKEQTHYVLKSAFLGCEETALGLVPMNSRDLTTQQFALLCEKVQAWLSEQGCKLPGVNDESAWPDSDEVIDRDAEAVR